MSAATVLPPRATFTSEAIFRLSVGQYHDMIARGTLTADDPVELIEGVLVIKMPKNPPHPTCNGRLQRSIEPLLGADWCYRSHEPVTLGDGEPEPDGVVARGAIDDYADAHPGPSDIGLLIEVSDSTLDRDRGLKLRSYARAGVACYWVVNLIDRRIEVYADPDSAAEVPRYRGVKMFGRGDSFPLIIDGADRGPIQVSLVLPPE